MKITVGKREFCFSLLGISVYLLLMIFLLSLGFWQLSRAKQKKMFLMQQQAAVESVALDMNRQPEVDLATARYQKILAKGHYDNTHQFLIDNQVMDGKPGYFVLTPFVIENIDRVVLVNRGWIALGPQRQQLPDVNIKDQVESITGRINNFPSVGFKLDGAEIPGAGWPSLLQIIDIDELSKKLGRNLYNFQIELDESASDGYKRQWKINTAIPPEKHVAYAVQWFGLALTLTILFFWKSSKKSSEYPA